MKYTRRLNVGRISLHLILAGSTFSAALPSASGIQGEGVFAPFSQGDYSYDAQGATKPYSSSSAVGSDACAYFIDQTQQNDTDGDGLSDIEEGLHSTNPTKADTDDDGIADGAEIKMGLNPTCRDTDGDGLSDRLETEGFALLIPLPGGLMVLRTVKMDALNPDTDGDGLEDGAELKIWDTLPDSADTDSDGLYDGYEANEFGSDPTKKDTDNDGCDDKQEHDAGTSPEDPLDKNCPVQP